MMRNWQITYYLVTFLSVHRLICSIEQQCNNQNNQTCPINSLCSSNGYCICKQDYILDCQTRATTLSNNSTSYILHSEKSNVFVVRPSFSKVVYCYMIDICRTKPQTLKSPQSTSSQFTDLLHLTAYGDDGQDQVINPKKQIGEAVLTGDQECWTILTPPLKFDDQKNGEVQRMILTIQKHQLEIVELEQNQSKSGEQSQTDETKRAQSSITVTESNSSESKEDDSAGKGGKLEQATSKLKEIDQTAKFLQHRSNTLLSSYKVLRHPERSEDQNSTDELWELYAPAVLPDNYPVNDKQGEMYFVIKVQEILFYRIHTFWLTLLTLMVLIISSLMTSLTLCIVFSLRRRSTHTSVFSRSNNLDHFSQYLPEIMVSESAEESTEMDLENSMKTKTCPICLLDFFAGESARRTICDHYFHTICLDEWCKQNLSCPVCRKLLTKKQIKKHLRGQSSGYVTNHSLQIPQVFNEQTDVAEDLDDPLEIYIERGGRRLDEALRIENS